MFAPIRAVRDAQTVQEAAAMLQVDAADRGANKDGGTQGFLTDRDIVTCCAAAGTEPTAVTVERFIRQDVVLKSGRRLGMEVQYLR
jgi:hypothetical protein